MLELLSVCPSCLLLCVLCKYVVTVHNSRSYCEITVDSHEMMQEVACWLFNAGCPTLPLDEMCNLLGHQNNNSVLHK
jgi:hypothetical protein